MSDRKRTGAAPVLGSRLVATLTVAAAGVMLWFAVPVVLASFTRFAASDWESKLERRQDLSAEELEATAGVLETSHAYRPDPAIRQRLGLIRLLQAERAPERSDAWSLAGDTLETGLAGHPASPHAWTRLARVRLERGERSDAREAWTLAVTTGPYVERLTVPRMAIGFALWADLDGYERNLLRRQAVAAFDHRPRRAVDIAVSYDRERFLRGSLPSLAAKSQFDRFFGERLRENSDTD